MLFYVIHLYVCDIMIARQDPDREDEQQYDVLVIHGH